MTVPVIDDPAAEAAHDDHLARDRLDRDHLAHVADRHRQTLMLAQLAAVLKTVRRDDFRLVFDLLCGWLDENGAGMPDPSYVDHVRRDAAVWADLATPAELEAYVAFGLRSMGNAYFSPGARKRLLVLLWEGLTAEDRKRFLAQVDPAGRFYRKGG